MTPSSRSFLVTPKYACKLLIQGWNSSSFFCLKYSSHKIGRCLSHLPHSISTKITPHWELTCPPYLRMQKLPPYFIFVLFFSTAHVTFNMLFAMYLFFLSSLFCGNYIYICIYMCVCLYMYVLYICWYVIYIYACLYTYIHICIYDFIYMYITYIQTILQAL